MCRIIWREAEHASAVGGAEYTNPLLARSSTVFAVQSDATCGMEVSALARIGLNTIVVVDAYSVCGTKIDSPLEVGLVTE
jgi:maleate cis-trans isomerase